jgi:hypothetical protein
LDAWNERAPSSSCAGHETGRFADVLAGIQSWESAAAQSGPFHEGIKRRVSAKVKRYLGPGATDKLLQSVSGDGGDLLSTVEPVLALFLGRKAASSLVSHVVDAAIVRF